MGAEVLKAEREAVRPALASTAAPQATARPSAAAVVSPQSLMGNGVLRQRAGASAGEGPGRDLLALQGAAGNRAVQRWARGGSASSPAGVHRAAQAGVAGPGGRLPHYQAIQRSFGPAHDLSGVQAHVGGSAAAANAAMHATAFTTGEHVAFKASPDLWLAAHEAAHVVQQRGGVSLAGGVGRAGDSYERQADTVADRVVSGRPAHNLLAGTRGAGRSAVQRCGGVVHEGCDCAKEAGEPKKVEETATETSVAVQRNGDGGLLGEVESGLSSAVSTVTSAAGEVAARVESAASTVALAAGQVAAGAESAAASAAKGLSEEAGAIAKALSLAATALVDPTRIPALISEIAWDLLPESVKGQVINTLLDAAIEVAQAVPPPTASLGFLAPMLRQAMIGFLKELRSYQTAVKVKIVNRLVKLWMQPSPEYSIGFLKGFALGLWDGFWGPFEALWDILKLAWRAYEAEAEFIATLASTDRRRALFNDLSRVMASIEERVDAAVEKFLNSKNSPLQLLEMIDEIVGEAAAMAQSAGAQLADALMSFLQQPDADLGHGLGRVAGNVTFEAVLLILTEGGWAFLKGALEGVRWISKAIEAVKDGARLLEGFTGLAAAFSRFAGVMRKSKVLSELIEPIEELFHLFIKYLKFSYGLGGAGERLGEHVGEEGERLAERLEREEVITDPLTGEAHELRLHGGVCERCSLPCSEIVKNIGDRIDKLPTKAEGELLTRVEGLRTRAQEIQGAGAKLEEGRKAVEAEKAAGTLTGRELRKREEALERQADKVAKEMHAVEVEMEGIEREERMRSKIVGEGFDQPLGTSDADIRKQLGLPEDSPMANFVGKRGDQWRIAESKGGNINDAVTQVTETAEALVGKHPEAAGKLELEVYVKPEVFKNLESGQRIQNYVLKDGKLGFEIDDAGTVQFLEIQGAPVKVLPAP